MNLNEQHTKTMSSQSVGKKQIQGLVNGYTEHLSAFSLCTFTDLPVC